MFGALRSTTEQDNPMKASIETKDDRTVVTTGNMETVFRGCKEAAIQIATLQQRIIELEAARSDVRICPRCGDLVGFG